MSTVIDGGPHKDLSWEERDLQDLVNVADYGFKGTNYYWANQERFGMSREELCEAGIASPYAYVDKELIVPLQQADKFFRRCGYKIIIKDAYRPTAAYRLAYRKLCQKQGKELTDKLLNMDRMPHATARAVDIGLIDLSTGKEVWMRDGKDDKDGGWKIGFYMSMADDTSIEYQRLQILLIGTMISAGFVLGTRREFWHFELPL